MVKQRKYTGSVAGSNPVLPKHFSVAVPKRGHIWPRNKNKSYLKYLVNFDGFFVKVALDCLAVKYFHFL